MTTTAQLLAAEKAARVDADLKLSDRIGKLEAALILPPPPVPAPPVIVTPTPPTGSALTSQPTPAGAAPGVGQSITANGIKTTHLADGFRHGYATRSADNADGTRLLLFTVKPDKSGLQWPTHLFDAATGKDLGVVTTDDTPCWSNVAATSMYGITGGSNLILRNILSGSTALVTALPFTAAKIGLYEGGPSDDDSLIPIGADDGTGRWCVVDHGVVSKVMSGASDNVKVARSAKYVVVVGADVRVYDRALNFLRTLPVDPNHGDTAIDSNGDDVFVMNNAVFGGQAKGVQSFRLRDGAVKTLLPPGTAFEYGHVSGRGKPGWYGLSVRDTLVTKGRPGCDQVVAVNDAGLVQTFGYAHRSASSAAGEPQATLSRTGLRAYTATDWGGSIGELVLEAA